MNSKFHLGANIEAVLNIEKIVRDMGNSEELHRTLEIAIGELISEIQEKAFAEGILACISTHGTQYE